MTPFASDDSPDDAPKQPMWRRYLRMIRPNHRGDLDDELRDHIESTVEGLVARGMTEDAARTEALRRFGDVARVRAEVTQLDASAATRASRLAWIERFVFDVRYALRALRRSPTFTIVATISIALGVATNATVFSVVNAILLRPIPGAHAPRLQRMYVNHHSPFDWTDLAWFRSRATSLRHVVGERYGVMAFRAEPRAEVERIHASYVTQGFFPMLGVRTALGRTIDVADSAPPGDAAVAVLTHGFWERRFGGDSSAIGRTIILSDHPVTVVGVAAPEFRSSVVGWAPDVFLPFAMAPVLTGHPLTEFGGSFYTTVQLQPGISPPQAEAQLRGLMFQLAATDTARYNGRTVRLDGTRGVSAEARDGVAAGSAFLMAMVAMVLLIACANVANLLLGRAAARRTEMGVRLAIGASRGRLVRQLLTESLLLATIGTIVGFAASVAVTRILPATLPPEAGIDTAYFAPDGRVLAFTIVLCVATTLLFGAVPALRAASPNLVGLLKGSASVARKRRRGMLVTIQAAMCVLLLAVAALFLRGLASARGVDPGFSAEGVVDANIDLGLLPRGTDRARLMSAILQDASSLNGVQSATLAAVVPLGGSNMETGFLAEGAVPDNRAGRQHVYFNIVAPRFFATLRTPILRGREFLDGDREGAPRVAVISETAARRFWPGADALGRRFHWGGEGGPLLEVVGIAHDANYVMPGEEPKATIYVPLAQEARDEMMLMVRTDADLTTMRRSIGDLVHRIAPELPPPGVVAMTDDMSITLLPVRAGAILLGAFGLIALVLATAGIYGVASYSVASRGREIGVRAALGATRAMLMRMVLWESGRRVATGAVVGLALTVVAGSGLSKVLYGVRPLDPEVILGVSALIALVAVVAALAPAMRAARVDPVVTMREE